MLGVISNVLTFMAAYICLDSICRDSNGDEVVPDRLKSVLDLDTKLVEEIRGTLDDSSWRKWNSKAITDRPDFTFTWQYSKAYRREIYKSSVVFNYPQEFVVDAFWIECLLPEFSPVFSDAKILDYAGSNRVIMWQQAKALLPGWLLSTRDYVSYFAKLDLTPSDGTSGPKTTMIVSSNTTELGIDFPEKPGVVRGVQGVAGWRITELSSSPNPQTMVEWLGNTDQKPPSILPPAMLRPVVAKVMRDVYEAWEKNMEKWLVRWKKMTQKKSMDRKVVVSNSGEDSL